MRNHFVPQFYLEKWCEPLDGRIPSFVRERDGSITPKRLATTVTGHEHGLYALTNVEEKDANILEHEFFTPIVDTPASPAYERLIQHGPEALTEAERTAWTRFLVASHMRTPDFIRQLREGSPHDFILELERRHNEQRDELPPGVPIIKDFAHRYAPALIENIGMTLLPQLICDSKFTREIFGMLWWIVDFDKVRFRLLTSDRPLWWSGPLTDEACMLAMPITPTKLFMACRRKLTLPWENLEMLAKFSNASQCMLADRTVYGRASARFVQKNMGARAG